MSISKRLRFDTFKRDEFQCVYCGAHPPDALLEVDHVRPVADGGENDADNLVTACSECNRGKGSELLSNVPQSLSDKAAETLERETQLRAYYEILQAKKDRRDDELWSIADVYMERFGDDSIQRSRLASIRTFLDRLDYFQVLEAMEVATRKMYHRGSAFRYFCGICWRNIKGADHAED
jgi:HNH endonuclease